MSNRIDTAERRSTATAAQLFQAFADPNALAQWLPPGGMSGTLLQFDFRPGGGYRLRLTYPPDQAGQGKTSADTDEVEVRFTRIELNQCIEQAVHFTSDDPAFAGTMRMTWTFQPDGQGTRVRVEAKDVPADIRPEDHQLGLQASLAQLAAYVEGLSKQK